jgi:serine/threonine protein kinase
MPSCSSRYPALAPIAAPKPCTSASTTSVARHGEFRLSDFERLTILGRGNGGTVYTVSHRGTSALYALKILHGAEPAAVAEVDIACRVDSPYIVRCHSVLPTASGDVSLLLEPMGGGSLDSLVVGHGALPEGAVTEVAAQALSAPAATSSRRTSSSAEPGRSSSRTSASPVSSPEPANTAPATRARPHI